MNILKGMNKKAAMLASLRSSTAESNHKQCFDHKKFLIGQVMYDGKSQPKAYMTD